MRPQLYQLPEVSPSTPKLPGGVKLLGSSLMVLLGRTTRKGKPTNMQNNVGAAVLGRHDDHSLGEGALPAAAQGCYTHLGTSNARQWPSLERNMQANSRHLITKGADMPYPGAIIKVSSLRRHNMQNNAGAAVYGIRMDIVWRQVCFSEVAGSDPRL